MGAVRQAAHRPVSRETLESSTTAYRWLRRPSVGDHAALDVARCGVVPETESVGLARDFTGTTLRGWLPASYARCQPASGFGDPSELRETVELVVSELVTNALSHGLTGPPDDAVRSYRGYLDTSSPVELVLVRTLPYLMCVVTDPSDDIPRLRDPADLAESGRGLHVVASCSHTWGWTPFAGGGKAVWAVLHGNFACS